MKKQHHIRSFLCGAIVMFLAFNLVSPAMAATGKVIEVLTGIKIYVDDVKLDPTDANGNPVDVFVYNGTTYLPVRAISEALGYNVQWDGSTQSVYIGKHSSETPSVWLSELDYFSGTSADRFKTATSQKDNTGDTHYHCITYSFDRTYLLNGQYTAMSGTIYQPYDLRSATLTSKGASLEIYGDGKLLYTTSFDAWATGIEPKDFTVDLTGVLSLQVKFTTSTNLNRSYIGTLALGDIGLWS